MIKKALIKFFFILFLCQGLFGSTGEPPIVFSPITIDDSLLPKMVINLDVPYFGKLVFNVVKENANYIWKAKLPSDKASFNLGLININGGEFSWFGETISYNAPANFLGKSVNLRGSYEFSENAKFIIVVNFTDKPKLNIPILGDINLDSAQIYFPQEKSSLPTPESKPDGQQSKIDSSTENSAVITAKATVTGQPIDINFFVKKDNKVDLKIDLKNLTMSSIIPQLKETAISDVPVDANIEVPNFISQKEPTRSDSSMKLIVNGLADFSKLPSLASDPDAKEAKLKGELNSQGQGILTVSLKKINIPNVTNINDAFLEIDTAKRSVVLKGTTDSIPVPLIGDMKLQVNSQLSKEKIEFGASIQAGKEIDISGSKITPKSIEIKTVNGKPLIVTMASVNLWGVVLNGEISLKNNVASMVVQSDKVPDQLGFPFNQIALKNITFTISNGDYTDPATKITYKKGVNLLANAESVENVLGPWAPKLAQPITVIGYLNPSALSESRFFANIPATINFTSDVSMNNLRLELSKANGIQLGAIINVIVKDKPEPLKFTSTIGVTPNPFSLKIGGTMEGMWERPFGVNGLTIANCAIDANILPPPVIPIFGIAGMLCAGGKMTEDIKRCQSGKIPTTAGQCATNKQAAVDNPICQPKGFGACIGIKPPKVVSAELDTLTISDIVSLIGAISGTSIKQSDILEVGFNEVKIYVCPEETFIGELKFDKGFTYRGIINFGNWLKGYVGVSIGADGFKAEGACKEIKWGPLLISKSARETETGCAVGCSENKQVIAKSSAATGKQGTSPDVCIPADVSTSIPAGLWSGPKVRMILTAQEQLLLVSGRLKIEGIYEVDNCVTVSTKNGISFSFETRIGSNDLLYSCVSGRSSGTISNPNFELIIEFKQRLLDEAKKAIKNGIDPAIQQVERDLNKAKDEVNKLNGTKQDVKNALKSANSELERAKNSFGPIEDAQKESNRVFNSQKNEVDKLQAEINSTNQTLSRKKNELSNVKFWEVDKWISLPFEIAYLGTKIGALESAKAVANAVLESVRYIVDKTLDATQIVSKAAITAAQATITEVAPTVTDAILESARYSGSQVLEGVKIGTTNAMKGAAEVTTAILSAFDLQRIYYKGSLEKLAGGILGEVEITAVIFGSGPNNYGPFSLNPKKIFETLAEGVVSIVTAGKPKIVGFNKEINGAAVKIEQMQTDLEGKLKKLKEIQSEFEEFGGLDPEDLKQLQEYSKLDEHAYKTLVDKLQEKLKAKIAEKIKRINEVVQAATDKINMEVVVAEMEKEARTGRKVWSSDEREALKQKLKAVYEEAKKTQPTPAIAIDKKEAINIIESKS